MKLPTFSKIKAFSIVEMMASLLIFSIVIGSLFAAWAIGKVSWSSSICNIVLQQNVRQAVAFMTKELRAATSSPIISEGGSQIDFSVSGIGGITYELVQGPTSQEIRRTVAGISGYITLANNVTALTFTSVADGITINITAQKTSFLNQTSTLSIVGNASLRANKFD